MQKLYYLYIMLLLAACSTNSSQNTAEAKRQDTLVQSHEHIDTLAKTTNSPSQNTEKLNTLVDKNYLLGKFNFREHPDFVKVEAAHTSKYGEAYLRKEAYKAFKEMAAAAEKDGVKLTIISAARNFDKQKEIWENKWKDKYANVPEGKERAEAILKFSSMPSTSRHHWGTDMDFNSLEDAFFQAGEGKKMYEWLLKHAGNYGFCNVYSVKDASRPNGYNEEKWHWSYMPLSKPFLAQYKEKITLADITGFEGSDTKTELSVIKNYVEGINPACQ